jgi:hypothetical protein
LTMRMPRESGPKASFKAERETDPVDRRQFRVSRGLQRTGPCNRHAGGMSELGGSAYRS